MYHYILHKHLLPLRLQSCLYSLPIAMVDISAPQPHLAPAFRYARALARTQSLPAAVADDTFYVSCAHIPTSSPILIPSQCVPQSQTISNPPRLLSPYRVPEDAGLRKVSSLYAPSVRSDPPILTCAVIQAAV